MTVFGALSPLVSVDAREDDPATATGDGFGATSAFSEFLSIR